MRLKYLRKMEALPLASSLPFEAHGAVALGVVLPFLAHLHEQEEMHAALEQRFEAFPRAGADRLDALAALPQHDGALVVALAEEKNMEEAVRFACKAASISVTRLGAQASAPFRSELE